MGARVDDNQDTARSLRTRYKYCASSCGSFWRRGCRRSADVRDVRSVGCLPEKTRCNSPGKLKRIHCSTQKVLIGDSKSTQKNLLLDSENLLLDSENLLLESENLLLDSENRLLDSETLLLDSETLLLDSDNLLLDSETLLLDSENLFFET
jgi:hypothetical protein